jgi:YegS/Rv2252/BmrU family lipid kinase
VSETLPRQAALVVNAKSRKGRHLFREACRLLEAAGIDLVQAEAIRKPAQLAARVEAAIAGGAPMVIVGGGDGTLSCSVDAFVGTNTIFAMLPLGTANSFGRTLGVPLDLAGAVEVIATGEPRSIDLGMIDDDYFANCASLGIAPQIAQTVPHGLKAWLGRPGYLVWAARQLARFRSFKLIVGEGADAETLDAVEVRIANGPYHGGVELVDDARLDSGKIVVQAVIGQTRRDLVFNWAASWIGASVRHRMTREFEGEAIRIATDPPLPISIDGEVLARTPVTARIARRAIRVAAPRRPKPA